MEMLPDDRDARIDRLELIVALLLVDLAIRVAIKLLGPVL